MYSLKELHLKHYSYYYLFFLLILLILPFSSSFKAYSQETEDNSSDNGWAGYPVLFYTNRTNIALGAFGMHYFKNEGTPHKSMTRLALVYTLRRQIITQLASQFYWADYRLKTALDYYKFPDTFYGIGNDTKNEDAEDFTTERVGFDLNFQKKIRHR